MNLKEIAKKHPAIARTLEVAFYSVGLALLLSISEGLQAGEVIINYNLLGVAFLTPIIAGAQKAMRDINKAIKEEEK